ncbi:MAG: hypothetical protein HYY03_00995, partial [Chloroflexi bacterium]|nr:hypothetical protein [Chloroflexota bacterium]
PVIGYLDDLLVVILGLWLFLRLCPRELFQQHMERLAAEAEGEKGGREGEEGTPPAG